MQLTTGMLVSGLFFGQTIGSHYGGATTGIAYGNGLIKSRTWATVLIAVFVIPGATFNSRTLSRQSALTLSAMSNEDLTPLSAIVMMLMAALVTVVRQHLDQMAGLDVPTRLLLGAARAMRAPIFWGTTVVFPFVTWIGTPIASGCSASA